MRNRIIFGAIIFLTAILITMIGNWAVCFAIFAISTMALFEMYKSLELLKKQKAMSLIGFVYSILLMVFIISKSVQGMLNFNIFTHIIFKASLAFLVILLIYMVTHFEKVHFSTISSFFTVTVYISVLLSHIILISSQKYGNLTIWFVFFASWGTDTCAYFAGRFFGKHKLIEKVSPKKTVEGAIGGALGAVVICIVYALLISKNLNFTINYINLVITVLISAIISQFGDLIASCIKRENNIKDYGSIIPGHGGILDRFDSVIAVSPVVFYLGIYLPIII